MWQVCPLCKGDGFISNPLSDHNMGFMQGGQFRFTNESPCTVCNGKKIISQLNGQPPAEQPGYDLNKTDTTNGNIIPT